jgi:hypothetical protein
VAWLKKQRGFKFLKLSITKKFQEFNISPLYANDSDKPIPRRAPSAQGQEFTTGKYNVIKKINAIDWLMGK